jgi:predicted amidohydrolase
MEGQALLELRNTQTSDVEEMAELLRIARPNLEFEYHLDALRMPIQVYPEGQFALRYEGKLVGFCSNFRINHEKALKQHTWDEITGFGFATLHDPDSNFLYGMDLCVHPDYTDLEIARRLDAMRRRFCEEENLEGVVIAGGMPEYSRFKSRYPDIKDYLEAIRNSEVVEPEIFLYLEEHYQIIDLLENYHPLFSNSDNHAVHLVWYNPQISLLKARNKYASSKLYYKTHIRVGCVQYLQEPIEHYNDFEKKVENYIKVASYKNADFVVLPELFALQLLSLYPSRRHSTQSYQLLTEYADRIQKNLRQFALRYNIHIIGGAHPTLVDGRIHKTSYIMLRNGEVYHQYKLHTNMEEKHRFGVKGGNELQIIKTDCGPIAVLIHYDCIFPELTRFAVEQGARIIFVPFLSKSRHDYLTLRYCAQARAVENQCFVAISGSTGKLEDIQNMEGNYTQSAIFTPSDFSFSRDCIAAEAPVNDDIVVFADLNMKVLEKVRTQSTTVHERDRRQDLYTLSWCKQEKDSSEKQAQDQSDKPEAGE